MVIKELVSTFLKDFMDQNPLANVAIILTYNQTATLLAGFSDDLQDHARQNEVIEEKVSDQTVLT